MPPRTTPLRRSVVAAVTILLLGLLGCSDGTGPDTGFTVTVTTSQDSPAAVFVGDDGLPVIECTVGFQATATGTGRATWLDAVLKFYVGRDRSTPVDSAVFAAADVQAAWGHTEIGSGETQFTGLDIRGGIPFTVTLDFRYRPTGGGVRTARVAYTCGLAVPPNAVPPVIRTLTVSHDGPVEPGDSLGIQYDVDGQVALWLTTVQLSGPCLLRQSFLEYPQLITSRTAFLHLPAACALGVPITVTVGVLDAALQESSRSLATGVSLVDTTPPQIGAQYAPPTGGSFTDVLGGDYFGGDSIDVLLYASDNHVLQSVIWEIAPAGLRDSLIVNAAYVFRQIRIPVPVGFTGPVELRLYAHDAVRLTSDTLRSAPDSVRVYPTVARPTAWTTVDGEIRDLAIDPSRGVIYLLQANQGRIAVLDVATLTVTRTVSVPAAIALDLSPGGDSLVVALAQPRALGIIDLRQGELTPTILPLALDTAITQYPQALRIAANGKAFVSFWGTTAAANTLLEVDLATGTQRFRTEAGDAGQVGGGVLGASYDRTVLVLNGGAGMFQRYTSADDAFGAAGSTIRPGVTTVLDSTGRTVAIGLDVYDADLQFLREVRSRAFTNGVPTALSPDGAYMYHTWFRDVVRSRVSDGAILDRSLNPILSSIVRVSADGALLVTAENNCCGSSPISIIRLR